MKTAILVAGRNPASRTWPDAVAPHAPRVLHVERACYVGRPLSRSEVAVAIARLIALPIISSRATASKPQMELF